MFWLHCETRPALLQATALLYGFKAGLHCQSNPAHRAVRNHPLRIRLYAAVGSTQPFGFWSWGFQAHLLHCMCVAEACLNNADGKWICGFEF